MSGMKVVREVMSSAATGTGDVRAMGAILSSAAAAGTGSVTVATITSSAPGLLGVLGFTTTTAVALPVAGAVAAAGLVGYGVYKGIQAAQSN